MFIFLLTNSISAIFIFIVVEIFKKATYIPRFFPQTLDFALLLQRLRDSYGIESKYFWEKKVL